MESDCSTFRSHHCTRIECIVNYRKSLSPEMRNELISQGLEKLGQKPKGKMSEAPIPYSLHIDNEIVFFVFFFHGGKDFIEDYGI
jgi:hypothetical protein